MKFLAFLKACCSAYRIASNCEGIGYTAAISHGVPQITVLVGVGREAWRVSNIATEAIAMKSTN